MYAGAIKMFLNWIVMIVAPLGENIKNTELYTLKGCIL